MALPPRSTLITREDLSDLPESIEKLLGSTNPHQQQVTAALDRQLTFGDNIQSQVVTVDVLAPSPVWTIVGSAGAPAFESSWASYTTVDGSYYAPSYMIDSAGWVHLRGLARSGTVGAAGFMFTLPTGYRPSRNLTYVTTAVDAFASGRVYTTGAVVAVAGANGWWNLSDISFEAAGPCAAGPRPTGTGWPISIKLTVPSCLTPLIIKAEDLDAAFGSPSTVAANPLPEWELSTVGQLLIRAVHGLSPGRKYRLTFLILAS